MSYVLATVVQKDPPSQDGRVAFQVEFTGDAGEPAIRREFYWGGDDTKLTMRAWVTDQKKSLNGKRTAATAVLVGDTLASIAPVVPTTEELAKSLWQSKLGRYRTLAGLSLVGQAATDLAALKADIEATYLTEYL
jgi:hypothetical protein